MPEKPLKQTKALRKIYSIRLMSPLVEEFERYVNENFNGNHSDAARAIFTWFFFQDKEPELRNYIALHFNLIPKVLQNIATISTTVSKTMLQKIYEVIGEPVRKKTYSALKGE